MQHIKTDKQYMKIKKIQGKEKSVKHIRNEIKLQLEYKIRSLKIKR